MAKNLNIQLAALKQMSPAQLREKYLELFGEPSRTGNKDFLAKRLAWRIQSLAEGGLSERARQRAAELARDADIRLTIPKTFLATRDLVATTSPMHPVTAVPIPGTILTRRYKGKLISATVLTSGFDYDGTVYQSLIPCSRPSWSRSHWRSMNWRRG